jgi:hypothetical protein
MPNWIGGRRGGCRGEMVAHGGGSDDSGGGRGEGQAVRGRLALGGGGGAKGQGYDSPGCWGRGTTMTSECRRLGGSGETADGRW